MNKFIKCAIILALTGLTQVASSQATGQYDQYSADSSIGEEAIRPNPRPRPPRPVPPPTRLQWYSAGQARTNKIINSEFTFRPRLRAPVQRLRIVGVTSAVLIRSVVVTFSNGQRAEVRQLEGRLREGQRLAVNIGGRYISEVRVVATSESLIGSRGVFRVDLAVFQ